METFRDSKGGLGALLEAFNIDSTGALLLSFHCEPCGGAFLLSGSSLVLFQFIRHD